MTIKKGASSLLLPLLIGFIVGIDRCDSWTARAVIPRSLTSTSFSSTTTRSFPREPVLSSAGSLQNKSRLRETSATTDAPSDTIQYNWKNQWYALTYASYVPNPSRSAEVTPASVFGEPLVLWRSENDGTVHCADDVCPHRAAALSEGRLRDGKLECYYHGWQFDGKKDGECNFIPQLEKDARIPKRACLKMRECRTVEGIVWAWMGDEAPTFDPPTQGDGMEDIDPITGKHEDYIVNDFQIDLPYDHSYLVENLIDPAHIPISHDATPGGGKRENAQAYEMILDASSGSMGSNGFTGRYRTAAQREKDDPFIEVQYEAPGIIRQKGMPRGKDSPLRFGAALHCMPLTLGRSRLLFRAYFTGLPPLLKFLVTIKPKFLANLNSCKILEQDAGLITTQEDHFKRTGRTPGDDYILLSSSDVFVKAYRQWLDGVGHGMPWFQGLVARSENVDGHLADIPPSPPNLDPIHHRAGNYLETRYHRHVMHCPATRNALRRIQALKRGMKALAIASITLSCGMLTSDRLLSRGLLVRKMLRVLVPLIPISSLAAAMLSRLESRFFVSFKRKEQMSTERGL